MKILSILFLAALMNLGLAQDSEEDNNPQDGIYFIFELGTQAFDSKHNLDINEGINEHFSIVPGGLNLSTGMGRSHVLGNRMNFRYQGSLLDVINVDFENRAYDDTVTTHSMEGKSFAMGVSGSAFLDFRMGESSNFLYLGSSIGLLSGESTYRFDDGRAVDWENLGWNARTISFESGAMLKLRSNTGFTLTYEFTHADGIRKLNPDKAKF